MEANYNEIKTSQGQRRFPQLPEEALKRSWHIAKLSDRKVCFLIKLLLTFTKLKQQSVKSTKIGNVLIN